MRDFATTGVCVMHVRLHTPRPGMFFGGEISMKLCSRKVSLQRHVSLVMALAFIVGFSVASSAQVRSIDGSGNNLADPDLGSANTPLLRRHWFWILAVSSRERFSRHMR